MREGLCTRANKSCYKKRKFWLVCFLRCFHIIGKEQASPADDGLSIEYETGFI
jgi:hypothetical protein